MLKPGKIPMIAVCALMLALPASCAAAHDLAPAEPDPALLEITSDADQLLEILPGQEPDGPKPPDESAGPEPPDGPAEPEAPDEPIREPVEGPNPIPFFVPDLDTEGTDMEQAPRPARISVPIPYIKRENAAPAISRKTSDPNKFEGDIQYFGRWIIQACGIDVACYLSWSQDVVDAEDAAAFFQFGDQYVIADHSNQDFISLDSCQPGDLACLEMEEGIALYVCTAIIQGHNLEESITDDAGNSIEYGFNTGGVTCYTCNDNWQNIHVVQFSPVA